MARCEEVYAASSHRLHNDRDARACFKWETGVRSPRVARDQSGRPRDYREKLGKWLADTLASPPGIEGIPLRPPLTAPGRIATSANLWGDLAHCHPLLRAWSNLEAAANVKRTLSGLGGETRLQSAYEVLPGISSKNPNLEHLRCLLPAPPLSPGVTDRDQIRRAGLTPMFQAPPGYDLLIGELIDLELRCLAEICSTPGRQDQLVELFRTGADPIEYVAAGLYGPDVDSEQDREQFETLRQHNPTRFQYWIRLARILLHALPRGMGRDHLRELIWQESGEDLSELDAHRDYRILILYLLPDLGGFLYDSSSNMISENLNLDIYDSFQLSGWKGRRRTADIMRDAISGDNQPQQLAQWASRRGEPQPHEVLAEAREVDLPQNRLRQALALLHWVVGDI